MFTPPARPFRAETGATMLATVVSGPPVTPTVLLAVLLMGLLTGLATGPVMALVTVDTTLAADVTLAGPDGLGWLGDCDPAVGPCAAGPWPWPWLTLWTVWLTLATMPPARDLAGPLLAVPPGACPGGVPPAAAALAAGPVLWPPEPPGMMSWVTALTAEAAALVAEAATWFALPLLAGGAGGEERWPRERPERRQRWRQVPGWPDPAGPQSWAGRLRSDCGGAEDWAEEAGPWLRRRPVRGCCLMRRSRPALTCPALTCPAPMRRRARGGGSGRRRPRN